jgi:hypothetical protein
VLQSSIVVSLFVDNQQESKMLDFLYILARISRIKINNLLLIALNIT